MSATIAITGARGYLGSTLVREFQAAGCTVRPWHRGGGPGSHFDLGGDLQPLDWSGIDAVVHCAYDFRARGWNEIRSTNVEGTLALLREARSRGVRFVFISSMSAYEGCRSLYGMAKLAVEKEVVAAGGVAVRPGLIYGDPAGGLFATIFRAVKSLPVIPMIGSGGFPQYLAHDRDLAKLLLGLATGQIPPPDHPLSAAHPRKILFRDLVRAMAANQGRRPIIVPIPWRLIHIGLRLVETAGVRISFRSDSLIGLVFANPTPAFRETEALAFREFPDGCPK